MLADLLATAGLTTTFLGASLGFAWGVTKAIDGGRKLSVTEMPSNWSGKLRRRVNARARRTRI